MDPNTINAIRAKVGAPPLQGTAAPASTWDAIQKKIAPPAPSTNLGDLAANQYSEAGKKITESIDRAGTKIAENDGSLKATAKAVGAAGEGLLGAGAGAVQGLFAPVTALIQKAIVSNPLKPEKGSPTLPGSTPFEGEDSKVAAAIKTWSEKHPDASRNLIDALTLGSVAVGGEAGILGKTASEMTVGEGAAALKTAATDIAKTGKEGIVSGAEATKGAASTAANAVAHPIETAKNAAVKAVGGDAGKLTESLKKSYEKISLPKGVMQEEAQTGKSFAQFMAEKPYLSTPVKDMKWDTYDTAQKLRAEVKPEAEALNSLLESNGSMISQDQVIAEMKSAIKDIATGQERAGVEAYIEKEIPVLLDQFAQKTGVGPAGEKMASVSDWNKVKQILWERSPFNPTASRADKLKSSVEYKMGQVVKRDIENAVDDADIQTLNSEVGDYYHAIQVLENLHGGAAPKGRIGLDMARIAGTIAGSPGGIVGNVAGYMVAQKIAEFVANPEITTAIKRAALRELKVERPTVAGQVAEILKKQTTEREGQLRLPPPSFIPLKEGKGGADIIQYIDILGTP